MIYAMAQAASSSSSEASDDDGEETVTMITKPDEDNHVRKSPGKKVSWGVVTTPAL